MVNLAFLTPAFAFLGSSSRSIPSRKRGLPFFSHSSAVSPYTATAIATSTTEPESPPDSSLEDLCDLLGVTPVDLIRLESDEDDGVRGVCVNQDVPEGDLIVKVPLQSCLLDDEVPEWWSRAKEKENEDGDDAFVSSAYNSPSDWAPRLAASLLDLLLNNNNHKNDDDTQEGQHLWLSYLPDSDQLRASLPVHWSEETLSSARCTALELAVDSAYFGRAEAVADLLVGLGHHCPAAEGLPQEQLQKLCQDALDVVQTRSCRVEQEFGVPVRVLAPVFDLINHGSSTNSNLGEDESANARFGVEGEFLCVRATKDLKANQEVLIDYGDSAKPAWKCLLSYGFVPQFTVPSEDDDDEEGEEQEGENVAEIFLDGHRYEVGPSTIPFDMVAAACGDGEEPQLTPDIALKLAKRISEVSLYLLVDDKKKQKQQEEEQSSLEMDDLPDEDDNIEELIALQRAASLRWCQHRILQACAKGLQGWAGQ